MLDLNKHAKLMIYVAQPSSMKKQAKLMSYDPQPHDMSLNVNSKLQQIVETCCQLLACRFLICFIAESLVL